MRWIKRWRRTKISGGRRAKRGGRQGEAGSLGLASRLDLQLDRDLLSDEHTAGLERLVPGDAPVLAVDLGLGRESRFLVPERVGHEPEVAHPERHRASHATDREVAVQAECRL